ncbi:MAG: ThiF family adenylyltransferase [Nanoarchaeota archaeon]
MKFEKHRTLSEIGGKNLITLEKKTASLIGLSSVGSVIAEILTRSHVSLRLIDKGRVEEEDLLTSSIYTPEEITRFKAKEAKKLLERINPQAKVKTFHEELTEKNAFLIDADLVIDCSNNPGTMEIIQKRCKSAKLNCITVYYAGAEFLFLCTKGGYNYAKWQSHVSKLGTVKENGLLASLSHIAGGLAATEAIKSLLGKPLPKKPFLYNALTGTKKEFSL